MIDEDPKNAKACVRKLAHLYRRVLSGSNHTFIPLGDELELVENFMQIQQYRFKERLHSRWSVPANIARLKFPPNMLLTLSKNAIKHGVESSLDGASVDFSIRVSTENILEIIVKNSFIQSRPETTNKGLGFGLQEMRTRLELLYGQRASIHLESTHAQMTVRLLLPAEIL